MKIQHFLSLVFCLFGVLALAHQYVFTEHHFIFQLEQIVHHETIAILLWALALGIIIGDKGE